MVAFRVASLGERAVAIVLTCYFVGPTTQNNSSTAPKN